MKTQSDSKSKLEPLNAWDRPWTRLHVGYYVAVFLVLSILLGFAHPIESLPVNLLIAALWPISTLVGFMALINGQPAAALISVICYAPHFLVKDTISSYKARQGREDEA